MNNLGSLYKVKHFYWIACATKEAAYQTLSSHTGTVWREIADYAWAASVALSKQLNVKTYYLSPNDLLVFLGNEGNYMKVLSANGEIGWIYYPDEPAWLQDYFEETK